MGYRLTKIYTRTGDKGTTGLGDGNRIEKDAIRMEAIGTVDKLNSVLGIFLAHPVPTMQESLSLVRVDERFDTGAVKRFEQAWQTLTKNHELEAASNE